MSEKDTFIFEDHSDIESAITAMNQGVISGYIYIPANFSEASFVRSILPMDIDSDTLNQSTVQVLIECLYSTIFLARGFLEEVPQVHGTQSFVISINVTHRLFRFEK